MAICWERAVPLFFHVLFVRFLLVFALLFILFRIALWPSAGKELSHCLFTCCFYFSAVLVVRVPFLFGFLGQCEQFDFIGS